MRGRDDPIWSQQTEPWDRLRWARTKLTDLTQEAFAEAIGMTRGAYRLYEAVPGQKQSKLTYDVAVVAARKLKVRWEWLLNGQGLPWRDEPEEPSPVVREIADLAATAEPEEQERIRDLVKVMLRKAG